MTLLIISFIAGVLTVLAPCILPLLPVIVGRSVSDSTVSKRRLCIVIVSLGVSIVLFTLLLKVSTFFIDIPQDFWKLLSGGIIFLFGLTMIFPNLWERISFTSSISRASNNILTKGYKKNNAWGDSIIGASLGPIFSACSPTYFVIIATVLPATPVIGLVYLFTYVFGLCLALIFVAFVGQRMIIRLGGISDPRAWFKRGMGVVFVVVALSIFSGYDKTFQITLLDSGFFDVTKIEQKLLKFYKQEKTKDMQSFDTTNTTKMVSIKNIDPFLSLKKKNKKFSLAPDISTPDGFINTDGKPITIREFKGKKVVLLDIWTYSCINCQRTIPYLNEWYKKYKDKGLVIIGLHTPEFSFEKIQKNVENAVKDFHITYPVVLDNDFSTWRALNNQYWPRKYLIDVDGYIIYDHAGEGEYDRTEKKIQEALKELALRVGVQDTISKETFSKPSSVIFVDSRKVKSPEIYFGSERNEYLANGTSGLDGEQIFSLPPAISFNKLYLQGIWNLTSEYAENKDTASIFFNYEAKNVYMAAGSDTGVFIKIYKDDTLVKKIHVKDEKLYHLIEDTDYGQHILHVEIPTAGLKVFTFTFG